MVRAGVVRAVVVAGLVLAFAITLGFSLLARIAAPQPLQAPDLLPSGAGLAGWLGGAALAAIGLAWQWRAVPRGRGRDGGPGPVVAHRNGPEGPIPRAVRRDLRRGGTAPERYRPLVPAWLDGHRRLRPTLQGNLVWVYGIGLSMGSVHDLSPAGLGFLVLLLAVVWVLPGGLALAWHRRWVTRAEHRYRAAPGTATPA